MKIILIIGILSILIGCHPQIRECRSAKMELVRALEKYLDSCGCQDSSKFYYRNFYRSIEKPDSTFDWSEFFKTEAKEIPGPGREKKQW